MSVAITIQETVNEVDITVNQNVITVNVTRTTGGGGGGVESVTGDLVDNTDPLNPVVNVPTLQEITDNEGGASETTGSIQVLALIATNGVQGSEVGAIDGNDSVILRPQGLSVDFQRGANQGQLNANGIDDNYSWELPNQSGTIAMLSDIGGGAVDSVNGQTGVVVLDAGDVGAEPTKGSDDNYVTDAQLVVIVNTSGTNSGDNATNTTSNAYADAKVEDNLTASTTVAPSKTAVNTALDLKAPIAEPTFSGLVTSVGTTQTGSSATGVLNLSQTWNTTGNPTALKLNVTNTASSASSLLFDFQVNGVSMGRLTKTGILTVGNGINAGSGAVQGSFFGSSGSVFNFGNNYMYGASGTATAATSGTKSVFLTDFSWSPTSGTSDLNIFNASPTINQTGGANGKVRGFYFNPTLTAAADAIAIDVQKGRLLFSATNTASGTTGNQTINKISGTVNFAAGASSLVVTNNLVTANSIVIPCVYGSDATASSARITPAAGSFTINLNAAATAETTVAFFVIN